MATFIGCGIALLGWAVLPGLGIALHRVDERDPGPVYARATAFGLATWILGSQLLAETVGITSASAWATSTIFGVAGTTVILRQRSRRVLQRTGKRLITGVAVVLVGFGAWAPVMAVSAAQPDSFAQSTPWFYWNSAELTAEQGSPPTSVREWGQDTPFLADYPGFTSGTVVLMVQSPGDDHRPAQAVMTIAVVSAVIGLGALIRSFGGSRGATVIATFVFLSLAVFATKLASYRPESLGYGLALLAAAMALSWLTERRRDALIAGGVCFVALGQVHGIVFLFCVILVGASIAATAASSIKRRWRGARDVLVLVGAWTASWASWTFVLNGRLSGAEQTSQLGSRTGLDDPTWEFIRAIAGAPSSDPPTDLDLINQSLRTGFVTGGTALVTVVTSVCVLVLVFRCFFGERSDRAVAGRMLIFAATATAGVLATGFWFSLNWDSYVPRRTGFGRLLQLLPVLVPVGVGAALSLRGGFRRTSLAVGGLLATALMVATLAQGTSRYRAQQPPKLALSTLEALDLDDHALVLANTYTEGFIPVVLDAEGLLDGRAPYTYPDLLERAIVLLRDAQEFYRDPVANQDFLDERHVTHVVAATPGTWSLGTLVRFGFDANALESLPQLREIVRDPYLVVYRVERTD